MAIRLDTFSFLCHIKVAGILRFWTSSKWMGVDKWNRLLPSRLYTMKKGTLNKINSKFNNSSKKRVLIVISCFFPFIGGDENTAKFLAEKLVKLGWRVTVLTKLRDKSLSKNEIINSVPVIRVGGDVLGIFIKAIQLINSFDTLFFVGALGGNLKIKVLIQAFLEIPKDKKLILFVGRASPEKNIQTLINAFKNLDDSFFLVLVLAVQLKEKNKFWDDLKATFPKTNFKFVINEPNPQKLMSISDVLIMPSIREGKGGVQFEAMACGTPSICSNLINITESLPNELLDLTFDPMNEDELLSKISFFFDEKQKTIKRGELIKFINENFSEEVILKKYINILS